jgi:hypothetical protein
MGLDRRDCLFNDNRVLQPGSTLSSEANILGESLLGTRR